MGSLGLDLFEELRRRVGADQVGPNFSRNTLGDLPSLHDTTLSCCVTSGYCDETVEDCFI